MPNIFQEDFRDFIDALNRAEVKYLLVGGVAVVLYGHARVTRDMDGANRNKLPKNSNSIWVIWNAQV